MTAAELAEVQAQVSAIERASAEVEKTTRVLVALAISHHAGRVESETDLARRVENLGARLVWEVHAEEEAKRTLRDNPNATVKR